MRTITIAICLLAGVRVLAQQRDGAILGAVTDPDGRGVASASIQAKNSETLRMPAIGFTFDRFEAKIVVVAPAQRLRVDIPLAWGSNLGTPGDDQSTFNIRKYGTEGGLAPRTREGRPDFSGVWIGNNDPNPEEPAMLPWAELHPTAAASAGPFADIASGRHGEPQS